MIKIDELNGIEAYKQQWEAYNKYKDCTKKFIEKVKSMEVV